MASALSGILTMRSAFLALARDSGSIVTRLVINKGGEREGRRGRATYGGAPPRVGPRRHRHERPWRRSRAVGVPPRNQHPTAFLIWNVTPTSSGFG